MHELNCIPWTRLCVHVGRRPNCELRPRQRDACMRRATGGANPPLVVVTTCPPPRQPRSMANDMVTTPAPQPTTPVPRVDAERRRWACRGTPTAEPSFRILLFREDRLQLTEGTNCSRGDRVKGLQQGWDDQRTTDADRADTSRPQPTVSAASPAIARNRGSTRQLPTQHRRIDDAPTDQRGRKR